MKTSVVAATYERLQGGRDWRARWKYTATGQRRDGDRAMTGVRVPGGVRARRGESAGKVPKNGGDRGGDRRTAGWGSCRARQRPIRGLLQWVGLYDKHAHGKLKGRLTAVRGERVSRSPTCDAPHLPRRRGRPAVAAPGQYQGVRRLDRRAAPICPATRHAHATHEGNMVRPPPPRLPVQRDCWHGVARWS